jgi:hypothetical protein
MAIRGRYPFLSDLLPASGKTEGKRVASTFPELVDNRYVLSRQQPCLSLQILFTVPLNIRLILPQTALQGYHTATLLLIN